MGLQPFLRDACLLATMGRDDLVTEPATASEGGRHMKVSYRITRLVAVGLAAGALASPVASARPASVDPGVSPTAREVARNAQSHAREVARSAETAVSQRDAAHSSYQPQPAQDLRSPDTRDAALISQGLMEPPTTPIAIAEGLAPVAAPADEFDWLDAAIGAGALGLALPAGGGTLAVRRRAHHDKAVAA
jgi:hypothetical protein